jgi:hypothetical protein
MIEGWVDIMAAKKKGWYRFIYKVWLGSRVGSDEALGVMNHAYAAMEAMKKVVH